jgi:hypothetical protein
MWSAAGIISFALFSLVDLKVNLLQKHMQFVEPLLAVFSGLALAGLWKRGWAGRALTWLLVSSLAWISLLTWAARVLYRTLPPGSG